VAVAAGGGGDGSGEKGGGGGGGGGGARAQAQEDGVKAKYTPAQYKAWKEKHGVTTDDEAEEAEAMVRASAEAQLLADMRERHMPALRRYRGPVLGSSITTDYTVTFDGVFNTVVCDDSNGVSSGKWFYEIEVLSAAIVYPQFGWADAGFESREDANNEGVGDDRHSWAASGS